jgi:hypothetical protein
MMAPDRLPDWERRLSDFIVTNRDRALVWGEWDCVLMACSAVEAMRGDDPAAAYRGRYSTKAGAAMVLKELGAGTLLRTMDTNFERRAPGRARRGDLVWFNASVGLCIGSEALFVGGDRFADSELVHRHGFVAVPRALWEKAWTV